MRIITSTVFFLMLLNSCASFNPPNKNSVYEQDILFFAVSSPIHGERRLDGEDAVLGARQAADELNQSLLLKSKNLKIQIIEIDDSSTTEEETKAEAQVICQSKASALIGPVATWKTQKILPLLKNCQIPIFSLASSHQITRLQNENFHRFRPSDFWLVDQLIEKVDRKNRIIILHDDTLYSRSIADSALEIIKKRNFHRSKYKVHVITSAVYDNLVKNIKVNKTDTIIFTGSADLTVRLINDIKTEGIQFFGLDPLCYQNIKNKINDRKKLQSLKCIQGRKDFDESEKGKNFLATFKMLHAREPLNLSAYTYDIVHYLTSVALQKRNLNGQSLIKSLREIHTSWRGITHEIKFNLLGEIENPSARIKTYSKNGELLTEK